MLVFLEKGFVLLPWNTLCNLIIVFGHLPRRWERKGDTAPKANSCWSPLGQWGQEQWDGWLSWTGRWMELEGLENLALRLTGPEGMPARWGLSSPCQQCDIRGLCDIGDVPALPGGWGMAALCCPQGNGEWAGPGKIHTFRSKPGWKYCRPVCCLLMELLFFFCFPKAKLSLSMKNSFLSYFWNHKTAGL